ncbi:MAG: polyprenyl synthetase family protein [Elusimicrobia bacterium]|nr:polyprenyl synthetase family protein [Elusimicrobiota bacterium]
MTKSADWTSFAGTYLPKIEKRLRELLPKKQKFAPLLDKAIEYVFSSGGKRIRPLLFIAVYEAVRGKISKREERPVISFASGVEFIHNYSLIHDDIMDGDDMRRGFQTIHKKFGMNIAILTGDALLTRGLEILYENFPAAARIVNSRIGVPGMISGQSADIENEGKKTAKKDEIFYIHFNKTAAFISGVTEAAGKAAGCGARILRGLADYGKNIGMAFQIRDDLLDRIGKKSEYKKSRTDEKNKKMTILRFFSMEDAKTLVGNFSAQASERISRLRVRNRSVLIDLASLLVTREK